ncbi:MAG: FeoB-associated Cys-rich membrane protein [Candidatus Gastranaerophilaceae bacterium]
MLTFFQENLATIFVGAAVLSVLILVLWYMYRQRKKARRSGGCGGSCCGCPHSGGCHCR